MGLMGGNKPRPRRDVPYSDKLHFTCSCGAYNISTLTRRYNFQLDNSTGWYERCEKCGKSFYIRLNVQEIDVVRSIEETVYSNADLLKRLDSVRKSLSGH